MKFVSGVFALVFALALAPSVFAHEGHLHKLMGERLQVKATPGQISEVVVNDKTTILRGAETQKASDIKPGERVVVMTTESKDKSGKTQLTAKEIRLGKTTDKH